MVFSIISTENDGKREVFGAITLESIQQLAIAEAESKKIDLPV
jgi:hypothetical protein